MPAPLVAIETVASSKLHEEAADTIAALDNNSEETKLWRTFIVATETHTLRLDHLGDDSTRAPLTR